MYTEKEALEYLVNLGEAKILEVDSKKFSTKQIYSVQDPSPMCLTVITLTALIEDIKEDIDPKYGEKLLTELEFILL